MVRGEGVPSLPLHPVGICGCPCLPDPTGAAALLPEERAGRLSFLLSNDMLAALSLFTSPRSSEGFCSPQGRSLPWVCLRRAAVELGNGLRVPPLRRGGGRCYAGKSGSAPSQEACLAPPVVCPLYGKRLTKLGLDQSPGLMLLAVMGVRHGHGRAAPWEPRALSPWRALVLAGAASLEGAGVISSRCGLSCGRTAFWERCTGSIWLARLGSRSRIGSSLRCPAELGASGCSPAEPWLGGDGRELPRGVAFGFCSLEQLWLKAGRPFSFPEYCCQRSLCLQHSVRPAHSKGMLLAGCLAFAQDSCWPFRSHPAATAQLLAWVGIEVFLLSFT